MANNRAVYQQQYKISIPREKLVSIASNISLDETDLRVLLMLLTQLDGYTPPKNKRENETDPLNFSIIDVEKISDTLKIKKKHVKKSINKIYDEYYIESGDSNTVKHGYRFTF